MSITLAGAPALVLTGLGAAVGAVARPVFAGLARVRVTRPLHPRGVAARATLVIDRPAGSGVRLLDDAGERPCLVRVSRAIGTPPGRPDIGGLALRIPGAGNDEGHADLLLASTGLGPVSRHVLAVRRRIDAGASTTLWPLLTPTGPTMVAALPLGSFEGNDPSGARFAIGVARGREPWSRIGTLEIGDAVTDPPVRFDSVAHPPAGAAQYPWVEAIRARAYAGARAGWSPAQTTSMGR